MLNLGAAFDRGVLTAAGIDPDTVQAGSVQINALPDSGDVTIRYTAVATAPASEIRDLIREAARATGDPATDPDPGS
jgi:hypothetical protein